MCVCGGPARAELMCLSSCICNHSESLFSPLWSSSSMGWCRASPHLGAWPTLTLPAKPCARERAFTHTLCQTGKAPSGPFPSVTLL